MTLTEDGRKQIAKALSRAGVSHTVFIRTQYDVLRRLRAYWVPRFLLHKEHRDELRYEINHPVNLLVLLTGIITLRSGHNYGSSCTVLLTSPG